ncbi:neuroblast differentiation-associated protein AHNAK [Scyliorhinus canicula]|uniref:neuroblast differentiation-associated protein AHNAK n=1 Tax=Scyliorhinus canicula TaxID=7830 RepID=UPI0018F6FC0B|nr:neuroblast differentiation-associated protein AHNAK [Scyliorhinus canicula]
MNFSFDQGAAVALPVGALSDGLTLSNAANGGIVIENIQQNSPVAKAGTLKKGDKLNAVTIHFDNLDSAEVSKILKYSEPYKTSFKLNSNEELQSPDYRYSSPGMGSDDQVYLKLFNSKIKPHLKLAKPDPSVDGPDMDVSGNNKMPSIGIKGPRISSDIGMNVKAANDVELPTNIDLTAPKFQADVKGPGLDIDIPRMNAADIEGKIKSPSFQNPSFSTPELPEMNMSVPELKTDIKSPDIEIGGVNVPETETNWKKPKLRMPSVGLSGPQEADMDLDGSVKAPGVDVSASNVRGNFAAPNVDLNIPKGDIDVNIPDAELNKRKFKMPKFNLPSSNMSHPDLDLNLKAPAVRSDLDAQLKVPKLRKPSLEISGLEGPNVNFDGKVKLPKADIKAPEIKTGIGSAGIDLGKPTIGADYDMPDMNLDVPDVKLKSPGIKMPTRMSGKDVSIPDVEANLPTANIDLAAPKIQADVKSPNIDINAPNVDVGTDGKFKFPKFKKPTFSISGNKLKGPDLKTDIKVPDADIGGLQGSVDVPETNAKLKMPKLEMPSFGLSGPKRPDMGLDGSVKAPGVDVSGPNIKGDYEAPNVDIKLPKGDIDANLPDADLKGGKFRLPGFNLPSAKVSLPGSDKGLKMPKGQVDLSAPDLQGDIQGPSLDLKGPSIDVDAPSVDVPETKGKWKMRKLEMPSFGLSGPKRRDMDIDGSVKAPGVDVSGPNIKGDYEAPNVDIKLPKGDIDANLPDADLKGGKFRLPGFNLPSGKVSLPGSDKGLKTPKGQVDLSAPDLHGGIRGPSLDMKGPSIDVDAPSVDVPDTKSKWKMPKLEMPSFGLSGPKRSEMDLDGSVKVPGVDVSGPNFKGNFAVPNVDLNVPKVDIDANISDAELNKPKFKSPKFTEPSLEMSGLERPDVNLDGKGKLPKADIKAPEFKTGIGSAGIDLGKPTIGTDYDMPDVNLDVPDVKLKSPGIKMPTRMSGKGISIPDVDANLPTANIDLAAPKIQADVKSPNLDINAPNVGGFGAEGKFMVPKFKKPTFSISGNKPKGPDLKTNIKVPDADIGGLQGSVDVPETNAKWKLPKLEMPSFGMLGPKRPDMGLDGSVKAPGVDVSGPNIKGDYEAPNVDIKLPKGDIDANIPDADLKGGKFRLPGFNLPSGKVSLPGSGKGLKTPKGQVDLSAPDLQGDIRGPSLDLKGPSIDVDAPSVDVPEAKGKWKMPKLEMPSFGLSGQKRPDLDLDGSVKAPGVDVSGPNIKGDYEAPNVDIKLPKGDIDANIPDADLKGGKFRLPGFNLPSGKVSLPGSDKGLKTPKGQVDLSAPDLHGGIRGPSLDMKGPSIDVDAPSVDVPEAKGKWKMPKLEMPSFGLSGQKKPDLDLDGSVKAPGVDASAPNFKGNFAAPNVDLNIPKGDIDVNIPDAELNKQKLKMPKFNLPSSNISDPDLNLNLKAPAVRSDLDAKLKVPKLRKPSLEISGLEGPNVNFDGKVKLPKADIKAPEIKTGIGSAGIDLGKPTIGADYDMPDMNLDVPDVKLKSPGIKMPTRMSGKDVSIPDVDANLPTANIDLAAPKIQADVKSPDLDINAPIVDVGTEGKFKVPKFKKPTFSISGNKQKGPDLKTDIKVPDADIGGLQGSVDVPETNAKWKMPKLEMPSFGLTGPKSPDMGLDGSVKAPGVDVSGPNIKGDYEAPNVDLKLPKGDIDANIPDADLKGGKFRLPGFNLPSGKVSLPGSGKGLKMPKGQVDLSAPDLQGDIRGPSLDLKGPSIEVPSVDVPEAKSKWKMPKLEMPSFGMLGPKRPDVGLDGSVKAPGVDVSGPNIKGDYEAPNVDIKLPKGDIDANIPDADLKGGKFRLPGFNLPSGKVSLSGSGKGLKMPKGQVDLSAPDLHGGIRGPSLDMKGPSIDVDAPSVDVPEAKGKWKMPKLEMPSFGLSGPKRADLDLDGSVKAPGVDVSGPNIKGDYEAPNVDIKLPKGDIDANLPDADLKGGKFRLPGFNLPSGKVSLPGSDKGLKTPKGQVDLSAPDLHGGIRGPSLDMKGPSIDVDVPEAKSKWKMPKLEMPSFGLSGQKRPDLDLDGSVKAPAVDVSAPNFKGNFAVPNVDLNIPKGDIDVNIPDAELNKPKLKTPNFTEPNLEMSGIEGSNIGLSGNVNIPKADASVPEMKTIGSAGADLKKPKIGVDFDIPNMNLDVPDAKVKGPSLNKPSLNMSPGNVYTPGVDIDPPTSKIKEGAGIHMPGGVTQESKLKDPNIDIKGAKVNVNSPNLHGDFREVGVDVNTENIYAQVNTPRLNTDNDENINMQNTFSRETFKIKSSSLSELDDDVSTLPQSDSNLKGRTSSTLHVTDAAVSKKSKFKFSNFFNFTHKSKGSVDFTKAKTAHSSSGTFKPNFPELELSVSKE